MGVLKLGGAAFLGLLIVGAAVSGLVGASKGPAERHAEDDAFAEFQEVQRAKRAVQSVLREPESARFGKVDRLSTGIVCGYVSSRNGFGGMTGMEAFMVGPQVGGLMMEGQGRRAFFKVWGVKCAEQSRKDILAGKQAK